MQQSKLFSKTFASLAIIAASSGMALAQANDENNSSDQAGGSHASAGATLDIGSPIQLAYSAAGVLYSQMNQSNDVRIPQSLLNGARCIAVFPSVLKVGLIFAGKNGDGIVACRSQSGDWNKGAPAYAALSGGSFGLEAGAKTTEVVMLLMNKQAVDQLTSGNFKVGAKVTATAGPVGARASVHTAPAPIVTYRLQSSGGFAGAEVKGATVSVNDTVNQNVYGQKVKAKQLLFQHSQVPSHIQVFSKALEQYAPSSKYNSQMKVKSSS